MPIIYFLIFIIGLCIGSFINALVFRLHKKLPVINARSICPECKKQLKWFHNIPLFSYIFLRGRCAFCKNKISIQYPLIELTTAILFFVAYFNVFNAFNGFNVYFITLLLYYFITITFLIIIFLYDLKYYLIPDKISLPAIVVAAIFQLLLNFINNNYKLQVTSYKLLLFCAIIGSGWFALQFFISHGRWVGGGDIRLGFLMGLVLSWPGILLALAISYIGGALICSPLLLLKKKTLKSQIPFGVFLVPATLISLFWGEKIVRWYLNLF